MRVVRLTVTPDADGVLRFAIPTVDGEAGGVDVEVVFAAADTTPSATAPETQSRSPQTGGPGAYSPATP